MKCDQYEDFIEYDADNGNDGARINSLRNSMCSHDFTWFHIRIHRNKNIYEKT